ncbi:AAC(3) family N-acetyltransferase [Lottiidibacillus patelloidae]|uniref:Aminoglycoside N(3)-acetyltransferase n=1 Tax=Lottiidibacillus patelloidae TaxID=2670334 RepID=A0A263BZY1_9BACI|nr:AAC(3) family N-acetyltransferase [Lottiidibacillus patelloidae]OZM58696.1 AAC(3) family N-acetyltransferase [Lottiidibacillus patelloidae]
MGEKQAVEKQHINTIESIAADLQKLGVKQGMNVIVHSSLSSLGWVCGGPVAVIEALMKVVTEEGMIVMPSQSAHLSDPANWMAPPVPEEWWETIRETMPAYDSKTTPTRGLGAVPELFRTYRNVMRSEHPALSFAGWGKGKEAILHPHPLNDGLGEDSPLGRMVENNFYILLIGVGHDSNTSMHLAEHADPTIKEQIQYAPIIENGKRVWKKYKEIAYDDEKFPAIGEQYEKIGRVNNGKIGLAEAKLFPQKEAVEFAKKWMIENASN